MGRLALATAGLWAYTAGIFAWIFPNVAGGATANAVTDVVIVLGGLLAAVGLPRAVAGIGTGPLRWGLSIVALAAASQNAVSAFSLDPTSAAPVAVVLASAVCLLVGVRRWQEDGWDLAALPWLALGFAGLAFEPLYYVVLGAVGGSFFGGYTPGSVLVAAGAGLAAWSFRPQGAEAGIPPVGSA